MALKDMDLLGKEVRDVVTGFTGRVTSISYDLYGCIQAAVSPPVDKEGKIPEGRWCDTHRLVVLDHKPCMPVPKFQVPKEAPVPGQNRGPADKPSSRA